MTIPSDHSAVLARNDWFARQPAAVRQRLIAAGRLRALGRGQWVYGQGDEATGLCAVLAGALRLEVALDPAHDVLIGLARPPMILGQVRRHGGGPRIVTARANGAAQVLLISDVALEQVAGDAPDLWRAVNELVYTQLEWATRLAASLLVHGPAARVATRLLLYADGDRVAVNQGDLAEMTGLSRKTVNAHLAVFEEASAITRGYRAIVLRDRAVLMRFAGR